MHCLNLFCEINVSSTYFSWSDNEENMQFPDMSVSTTVNPFSDALSTSFSTGVLPSYSICRFHVT